METKELLIRYAAEYETAAFLDGDPSWFMHQVEGSLNQETTAFVASCLSYGRRSQFMPKIQWLIDRAEGDMYEWTASGRFTADICQDSAQCFYRLYTYGHMHQLLSRLSQMLQQYGSMGQYVAQQGATDGLSAVQAICSWFAKEDGGPIVPKNAQSACKRICMFLRWMVRNESPVDLGLWSDIIDRRTLIMPLDTHVVQQSVRLGLLHSSTASMAAARQLTNKMTEIFPDDPLKGDFALFGYGVNHNAV
ncbi:MAG: TIGR02757 family protein [Prevotella sp.]|nr:TIGR02757 family protein [Prevotella sp.]